VNVRTADPAGPHSNQDLSRSGFWLPDFFNDHWVTCLIKTGSFHGFHKVLVLPILIASYSENMFTLTVK
jgi:hypothetical protein